MKKLIVNADDFGLSKAVNRGIIHTHRNGIVTSTSLMVNTPGFKDAVQWADQTPSLGIGFHFNLSYGKPLSDPRDIPSLVTAYGTFKKMNFLKPPEWEDKEVEQELTLQWNRIQQENLNLTHLDTHHYIQRIPSVYLHYARLARKTGLPMRHTFQFPPNYNHTNFEAIFSHKKTLPLHHPVTTHHFIGDVYFKEHAKKQLKNHVSCLSQGTTEINCHPGYVDQALRALSTWTSYRETEIHTLTCPEIKKLIDYNEIALVTFRDLMI